MALTYFLHESDVLFIRNFAKKMALNNGADYECHGAAHTEFTIPVH
jgi:hypothetical protein